MSTHVSRSTAILRSGVAPALIAALIAAPLAAPLVAWAAAPLRDPTRPPAPPARAQTSARPQGPVLSAVMSFNGRRTAIFNGRLVHDGSVVGAFTIDSVLEDGLRYREAGLVHELHLPHPEHPIKKPAAEPARVSSGESP